MLTIDQRAGAARLSLDAIVTGGRRYVSAPAAFASFAAGLRLTPDLLSEPALRRPAGAAGRFAFFRALMHGAVPRLYDVAYLERLGGRFALRVVPHPDAAGDPPAATVGDFTVTAVNRRVLTLSGLPLDEDTGAPLIDAAIRADAFQAFWNDRIADLAAATLARIEAAPRRVPSPA